MASQQRTRRQFLAWLSGVCVAVAAGIRPAWAVPRKSRAEHPEPRPGIDASNVLTHEQLQNTPDVIPIYDGIREIPHIADGIRCHCGCADLPTYRSLLTCYEEQGMAMWCEICQGQGRVTYRLHKAGRTLDQIREAIDARFG
jgi:hypothetical protein